MSYFYEGIWRLDWGFQNPNRTATLIAMFMVGCWGLAWWRRGFWPALFLFAGLGVCLLHTFSRGGFLAAAVGCGVLLFWLPRPWSRVRTTGVIVVLAALAAYASLLGAAERYASSWQGDLSVLNRLEIWKSVPRMLVDAPQGWGSGNAHHAYMNWYQSIDRTEKYINLVSTHFTVLTEISWPLRVGYVLAWAVAFGITWPERRLPWLSIPFGILAAFFVAAIFTHMGNAWPIYALAVVSTGIGVAVKFRFRQWPKKACWMTAGGAATFVLLGLITVSWLVPGYPLIGSKDRVIVGKAVPAYWVVQSDSTFGRESGKAYRRLVKPEAASAAFTRNLKMTPLRPPVLVMANLDTQSLPELERISPVRLILFNPGCHPDELPPSLLNTPTKVIFGEFSKAPSQMAWRDRNATILPGAGDFIPDWPLVLKELLLSNNW